MRWFPDSADRTKRKTSVFSADGRAGVLFMPFFTYYYMSFSRIHRFSGDKYRFRPRVRGSFMLPTAFQSLFTSKSPHGSPHSDRIPIRGWQPGRLFLTHFSCSGSDFLRNFVLSSRAAGAQRHESYRWQMTERWDGWSGALFSMPFAILYQSAIFIASFLSFSAIFNNIIHILRCYQLDGMERHRKA